MAIRHEDDRWWDTPAPVEPARVPAPVDPERVHNMNVAVYVVIFMLVMLVLFETPVGAWLLS
jgi:hypothetical protein